MLAVCCEGVLVPCVGAIVCGSPTGLGSTGAACNAGEAETEDCGGRANTGGEGVTDNRGGRANTGGKGGIEYSCGRARFKGGKGVADNRDNGRGGTGSWAMGGFIIGKPLVPLSEAPTKLVRSRLVFVRYA